MRRGCLSLYMGKTNGAGAAMCVFSRDNNFCRLDRERVVHRQGLRVASTAAEITQQLPLLINLAPCAEIYGKGNDDYDPIDSEQASRSEDESGTYQTGP